MSRWRRRNWLAAGCWPSPFLLRRDLHDVAEALDAAEHRDRRRGALPPVMIGWAAATGTIGFDPASVLRDHLLLDAAAFLGARALQSDDYGRAGVPMLPNGRASPATAARNFDLRAVLRRSAWPRHGSSATNGVLYGAIAARGATDPPRVERRGGRGRDKDRPPRLFGYSILYLFLLFAALVAEHGLSFLQPLGLWGWHGGPKEAAESFLTDAAEGASPAQPGDRPRRRFARRAVLRRDDRLARPINAIRPS